MKNIRVRNTNFYGLEFASQMIVWATRKRLHLLAGGEDDSHVVHAFRVGGLDDLYAALMSVVDVLTCGASNRLQLHAVACPCLAPHEISLLNALAHLQSGRNQDSHRCMCDLVCAPAIFLVLPAMRTIVEALDARHLHLTPIAIGLESGFLAGRFSAAIH